MPTIFISHATADQALAHLLVNFLKEAIGVPERSIFCSSISGHDIPLAADFNQYIKDMIKEPELVIILMTPTYMERPFCLMELGATWVRSHQAVPIVVPPVSYGDVTRTLGLTQSWEITKPEGLQKLREKVSQAFPEAIIEYRSPQTWDAKRERWKQQLPDILDALPGSSFVEKTVFQDAQRLIADQAREVQELAQKLVEKEAEIIVARGKLENLIGSGRVLVIEDEPLIALDLEQLLTDAGFKVIGVAQTGGEGRKLAERHIPEFIVSEIQFKDGTNGKRMLFDIAEKIDCALIMVTAYHELLLKEPRPIGYLVSKPLEPAEFTSVMYKAARERQEYSEIRAKLTAR
ncbi:TIR domain-containing protein [Aliirhizobium smilacinae]|uniref:TIR domain-containing protein n=1 Tax=Aliirhizobium smilacinae TaxID=1395944 RepID=A0A5C4XAP6_9HYPH|nr:TIR domain-containing protein [Rhizobium smilacinae]TNM59891.1 TIR domain-containing protein [Rhizobium smilacinae]